MSIKLSDVFSGLREQQLPALVTILSKAKAFAEESGIEHKTLLDTRLSEDMHPLSWQLQTTVELICRGLQRLLNQEPTNVVLDEGNFDQLIERIEQINAELAAYDLDLLDKAGEAVFDIPIGPEASLSLTGNDYVIKFLLPNVYFHLTTAYALLRMKGVDVGKRDYMGPF